MPCGESVFGLYYYVSECVMCDVFSVGAGSPIGLCKVEGLVVAHFSYLPTVEKIYNLWMDCKASAKPFQKNKL